VNILYHSCSRDPQFLEVIDWPLISVKNKESRKELFTGEVTY